MDNGSKGNMYHGTNEIYLNNLCIFKFVNSNITIFFILLLKFFFNFIKNEKLKNKILCVKLNENVNVNKLL